MKRFTVVLMTLLLISLLCTPNLTKLAAAAEQKTTPKVTLRLSHQYPDSLKDDRVLLAHEYARMVEEKSKGEIKINIYPAESLFKANAAPEALMTGTLDMCLIPMIYLAGKIPALNITLFPALLRSRSEIIAWKGKEIDKYLKNELLKNKLVELAWGSAGSAIGSTKKPIILPTDIKGTTSRVAGKYTEFLFNRQGAKLVSMSSAEVYTALQQGILEVCSVAPSSFVTFRYDEVIKFYNPYPLYINSCNVLMGKPSWDKLTKQQQEILLACIEPAEQRVLPYAESVDEEVSKLYAQKGLKVHKPTVQEFKQWEAAATETRNKFIKDYIGGELLLRLADEANAQYRAAHGTK